MKYRVPVNERLPNESKMRTSGNRSFAKIRQ
jgi:hypothetical protein